MSTRNLWLIILSFAAITIWAGFWAMTKETTTVNEIQGIIDQAGVIALREAVDDVAWREERLELDEGLARRRFIAIVRNELDPKTSPSSDFLRDYRIRKLDVYTGNQVVGENAAKAGQTVYLESTIEATVPGVVGDTGVARSVRYGNIRTGNIAQEDITFERANDGQVKTIIHTTSRLVLR